MKDDFSSNPNRKHIEAEKRKQTSCRYATLKTLQLVQCFPYLVLGGLEVALEPRDLRLERVDLPDESLPVSPLRLKVLLVDGNLQRTTFPFSHF